MKAWHFLREDKKLGYSDGRLVRVGHTFKCDPEKLHCAITVSTPHVISWMP